MFKHASQSFNLLGSKPILQSKYGVEPIGRHLLFRGSDRFKECCRMLRNPTENAEETQCSQSHHNQDEVPPIHLGVETHQGQRTG